MRQSWKDYERELDPERGSAIRLVVKIIIGLTLLLGLMGSIGWVAGWFTESARVAQEEFGARALLEKYEWFKSAAAQLDKKRADIAVYEQRLTAVDASYAGMARREWPRDDREQYNLWLSEVAGVKASYNSLAAEYNAQMAKFNWRFANVGELPKGAEIPLPREFRPYTSN